MRGIFEVEEVLVRSWGILEIGEVLVTSEGNFLMKGVGGDTMVGEIGTLQSSKVFCITRSR